MAKLILAGSVILCGLAWSSLAGAAPVVYTLHTVSDGKLGSVSFSEAPVVIEFHGDTRNVVTESSASGVVLTNYRGWATVTVTIKNKPHTAHFKSGEVFVRYDTTNGLLGFGSAISPTYPITLGCGNADCTAGDGRLSNGIVQGLALVAADPATYASLLSTATEKLKASLTQTTLLTGSTHACPVAYTLDTFGTVQSCAPAGAIPVLHTDSGDFYLEDQVAYPDAFEGNVAAFTVVTGGDDD